jgi:hypothetical protein
MAQAAAIIVVICEASTSPSESFARQKAFAETVASVRQDLSAAKAGAEDVPLVLMRFDEKKDAMEIQDYETVLRASEVSGRCARKASKVLCKVEA